jgi:hypothetical protein
MVFEGDDGGAYDFSWKKCTQFGATESGVFWGLAMRTANLLVSQSVSQSVSQYTCNAELVILSMAVSCGDEPAST